MEYTKVISYADVLEIYQYEKRPLVFNRKKRKVKISHGSEDVSDDRQAPDQQSKQKTPRREANIKRAVLGFKRLVKANISIIDRPILLTLTYAENTTELVQGRRDFNAFVRDLRCVCTRELRYIAVAEYQRRGAIHFHTLVWGLPISLVRVERDTRLVAKLWGKGFVDLIETDGSSRLAHYLAKYFGKQLRDPRFVGRKAYIASQNIIKPVVDKDALLSQYFHLSTYKTVQQFEFMTQWLGRGRYRLLEETKNDNANSVDGSSGDHV